MALIGEGANIETASYNELYLVKKMLEQGTFNTNIRILCNGPKTSAYMSLIDELQHKGLRIVPIIEGPNELSALQHSRYDVGIRLDMPVKADSIWNKPIDRFGFRADELLEIGKFKHLRILHYHVGSQINKANDILGPDQVRA
jgi:arginine decarboxylase